MITWNILMKGLLPAYGCCLRMDRSFSFLPGFLGERRQDTEARMYPQSAKQLGREPTRDGYTWNLDPWSTGSTSPLVFTWLSRIPGQVLPTTEVSSACQITEQSTGLASLRGPCSCARTGRCPWLSSHTLCFMNP